MKRSWLWLGAGVVALAFLYAPSLGIDGSKILWVLFLLACPLMHFLGFHGRGGHGQGGHAHGEPGRSEPDAAPRQLKGRDEA
ncbi:MAG: DUF2933 domain-containing protein [Candidatus Rokubacteria bacterium]|nr:DUF2933 domain-containing protein [Candidatus Rokubacteria bacterium]